MKKILLTTVLGLSVAFGDRLNLQDVHHHMMPLSKDIQNQLDDYFRNYDSLPRFLSHIYADLRNKCLREHQTQAILKDVDDSTLLIALKRIFPDANHIYYCYKLNNDDPEMFGTRGTFSFLLTSEEVTLDNMFSITNQNRVHYVNFSINTNTFKLVAYNGAFGKNRADDTPAFSKVYRPNGRIHAGGIER